MNWQFTGALSACLLFAAASASADDEDHLHVCPLISAELLQKIVPLVKGHACSVHCKGCGCKGGPGYRASDGQCVGYEDLISKCGPPPHAGCHRECAPVSEGCLFGRVWLKAQAAAAGLALTFVPADPANREPGK